MPQDLVIDTNVLVHANNEKEKRQQESFDLLTYLIGSTESIYLDEGFDLNETLNKSYIGYEYLKHLKFGMLGYVLITVLAQSKRIREVPDKVHAHTSKCINQCMQNNHDRVFIKVTINSPDKVLVTHDFTDFSKSKRKHLKKTVGIDILVASDLV